MKVLIVSDTHGRHAGIEEAIEREKPFQLLIHLGDTEGYEDYYEEIAGCPMHVIAGNNDYRSRLPQEKEIVIDGLHVLLTHGHTYYVNSGYDHLRREAGRRKVDIVMFGHTHRPVIREEEAVILLNPGSLSFPRQTGRARSYIVMEKRPGKRPVFEIRYLDESGLRV